jgi:hypothetical protein
VENSLEAAKGLCYECSPTKQGTISVSPKDPDSNEDTESDNESVPSKTEFDGSYSELESSQAALFADAMTSIATDLLSVLDHDMALLARLLPHIHACLQESFCYENTSYAGSDYNTEGDSIVDCGDLASSTTGTRKSSTSSSLGKRGRDDRGQDDEGDDEEDERPKRSKGKAVPKESKGLRYACPFHKKSPLIFTNVTGTKYRSCSGPGQTEVRRLK